MTKTTERNVETAFFKSWIITYGIENDLLPDNSPQFVGKLFAAVCLFLGLKQLTKTAYHPQTNLQTEKYNKTIVPRLQNYVAEHQSDWDEYINALK